MTGLEKIVRDISKESETAVSAELEGARRDAEQIRAKSASGAEKRCSAIRREAEKEARAVREHSDSAAALQRRRAVLEAKQQIIAEVLKKARQALREIPEDEYFRLILQIAAKYALSGEGEIIFSPDDRKRLPEKFGEQLNAVLKKGAFLIISDQTRKIDGGFILVYGGVEENCSFSALFDAKREEMQDKVQALLFAEA